MGQIAESGPSGMETPTQLISKIVTATALNIRTEVLEYLEIAEHEPESRSVDMVVKFRTRDMEKPTLNAPGRGYHHSQNSHGKVQGILRILDYVQKVQRDRMRTECI